MNEKCKKCGKLLYCDEIGLYKKLINRGATEFLCKKCLSEELNISVEKFDEMIARWKKQGCSLFY